MHTASVGTADAAAQSVARTVKKRIVAIFVYVRILQNSATDIKSSHMYYRGGRLVFILQWLMFGNTPDELRYITSSFPLRQLLSIKNPRIF